MQYPDMRQLMNKVTEDEVESEEQIAAISQLIADRTEDADSPSKLSTEAFIGIINKMGLPLTKETLMDLAEKGSLNSVISDVNMDEIQFKGQQDIDPTDMTVDKAKDVVANMAKRSAKKHIKKEGEEEDNKRRDDIAGWNKDALDKHNAKKLPDPTTRTEKGVAHKDGETRGMGGKDIWGNDNNKRSIWNESKNVHDTMKSLIQLTEGYTVLPPMDERYTEREGLEGPFRARNGQVYYYDPRAGKNYNPDTDFYISDAEWFQMDRNTDSYTTEADEEEEQRKDPDYEEAPTQDDWDSFIKRKQGDKEERKEVKEDWGSSDWYGVIKSMDEHIDKYGMSPKSIKDAATEAASFWGDAMGHDMNYRDGEEDAIEDCIGGWMRMSKRGQQLQKMFAPK